jgi:hypothetical protein
MELAGEVALLVRPLRMGLDRKSVAITSACVSKRTTAPGVDGVGVKNWTALMNDNLASKSA